MGQRVQVPFWLAALGVISLACVCYLNSLDGDFLFDDSEAIVGNKDLQQNTPLLNLFANDFWGTPVSSSLSHKSYRPLTVVTFRWSYFVGGGLNRFAFHSVNVALHALTSVLFLVVVVRVLGESWSDAKWSAVSAVLFAVHPVHSESVAAVVGRADLLASALFFLAILAFGRCAQHCQDCSGDDLFSDVQVAHVTDRACSAVRLGWLLLTIVLCSAAMLCKEQGVTALALCSVYDLFIVCKISPSDVFSRDARLKLRERLRSRWRPLFMRQLTLMISTVSLLFLRLKVMGGTSPSFQRMDNPASFANSTVSRFLSHNYIYSLNAWLLVCPVWLCFDWAMGCVPLVESFADPRTIGVFLFWLAFLLVVVQCCRPAQTSHQHKEQRQVAMALALLVIPFLPASNIFFRVGFVIAERTLYLPSSGWCLLLAIGLFRVFLVFPKARQVLLMLFVMVAGLFLGRAFIRSHAWRREDTLYTSGLEVCPLNAKVHYNIGKIRADAGRTEEAIAAYTEAIRLHPAYDQALNNLGNILKEKKDFGNAEHLLERAVAANPKFAAAWMNLGIVKGDLKKTIEAETCFKNAIQHRKNYPDAYYNLGNLYHAIGHHEEAIAAWKNATILKPKHKGAWHNMALLLEQEERLVDAEATLKQSLKLLPDSHDLLLCLGNVLGKLNRYVESETAFKKSIELASNSVEKVSAYGNLGVLFHRARRYDEAEETYRKALLIHPGDSAAQRNLQMLLRTMGKKEKE